MKSLNWTSIAIIIGLPTLLAFEAWLIWILSSPDKWCGVQVTDDKLATRPIADCTSIVLQLIHWLGWVSVAVIASVCIAFLTIVARDLRAALDVHGNGWGAKVGGDDAPAVVTTTTTVAAPAATTTTETT